MSEKDDYIDHLQTLMDEAKNSDASTVVCAITMDKSGHPNFKMVRLRVASHVKDPMERELLLALIPMGLQTHTDKFMEEVREKVCKTCDRRDSCAGSCGLPKR